MRRFFSAGLILNTLLSLAFPVFTAQASVASPTTYALSTHEASAAANHELKFTTSNGVDASSDTVILTLPDSFSLGSVGIGDMDLLHGPTTGLETSETLAASAAAGTWGVSLGSNVITFTAPTDAAVGEISADHIVTIRIGTNAAGGANSITNPSSSQVVQIILSGTFGDFSDISVPIISDDSITVSVSIPAPTSSGGGGGDVVPPVISGVSVINITSSTASVIWTTTETSDSAVYYGLTNVYGSGTASNADLVLSHQINLSGLSADTTYHFRVSSKDTSNNIGYSSDYTFKTLGDETPPVISGISVVDITDTSARVVWQTNELATSRVDYGTSTQYGLNQTVPGLTFLHSILLTGLTPLKAYHFFVTSEDASANAATSSDGIFITLSDMTPPANVTNFTASGGNAVVYLDWVLPPDPDLAGARIVRRTDNFPADPQDGVLVYLGSATSTSDANVQNGTKYYYGAFAYDTNNNFSSGALASATPQGPPPEEPKENTGPLCSNNQDDDKDGAMDCADTDCKPLLVCASKPPPQGVPEDDNATCTNSFDDDKDGAVDCADDGCQKLQICAKQPPPPLGKPAEPIPDKSTPTPSGKIIVISPIFYGAGGTVPLSQDASKEFGAPIGSTVKVVVPLGELGVLPEKGYLKVGDSLYNLTPTPDGTAYSGTFIVPGTGSYPVTVSLILEGGGSAVSQHTLLSQWGGKVVLETVKERTEQGIEGAAVSLFVAQNGAWVLWNGSPYNQGNPQMTTSDGNFIFVVPNGRYYIEVTKDGYAKAVSSPRYVSRNVFGENVGLITLPASLKSVINPEASLAENIANIAKNIAEQAVYGVTAVRTVIQKPEVQEAVKTTISPTIVGISVVNLATAFPLFNALAYLQYLFTQPILLLGRRKRKKWGVVYNSLTKQPVELAIVRLMHYESKLVVQTKVTDRPGRYLFVTKPGKYQIEVVKPGYVFPTQYLEDKAEDVEFLDLYHGAVLETDENGIIAVNVPLDPFTPEEAPRRVLLRSLFRAFQKRVAFASLIAALISFVIAPSVTLALIVLAQVGMYLLFRRLGVQAKAKNWGIVFDAATRKPLTRVVVRIFDKKFNKLLETQVTDMNGKYGFFVRRNVYYVTAEKDGYKKWMSPDIDLSAKDEALVDQNIPMASSGVQGPASEVKGSQTGIETRSIASKEQSGADKPSVISATASVENRAATEATKPQEAPPTEQNYGEMIPADPPPVIPGISTTEKKDEKPQNLGEN